MNILYCGDKNIEDGLIISVLSLLKHVREPLHIYVMTMELTAGEQHIEPVSEKTVRYLETYIRQPASVKGSPTDRAGKTMSSSEEAESQESTVTLIDATELFMKDPPTANMETRFTPCCMLRLYADQIRELPDRILYLDNDVVCKKDCASFYHQEMKGVELAGTLDYYGRWFFRRNLWHLDYMNSGVLLLNLPYIRETGLFEKCRRMCAEKKMFMPDQSAINKLAVSKKQCGMRYNDQRKLHADTVFQHFTTSFRFFPTVHTVSVKPWQIDQMHEKLKLHEYDDILDEYSVVKQHVSVQLPT